MNKTCFSFLFLILFCEAASGQTSENEPLSTLTWLEGKWERVMDNPKQKGFEEWEFNENMLNGFGVTLQGSDTVFTEKLSIQFNDNELYYIADVNSNPQAVFFKIAEYSSNGFISENRDHDFPKKIEYQLTNDTDLSVIISGDGRSMLFTFKKNKL